MDYILSRLKEPSTYKGFLALAAAFGLHIDAAQSSAVVAAIPATQAWLAAQEAPSNE